MVLSDYKVGAGLAVSDMQRAREFYEGKLGLAVSIHSPENVQYRCAEDSVLHIYLSPEHAGKATETLASWGVDDIERVVEEAHREGRNLRALRRRGAEDRPQGHRHLRGRRQGRLLQGPGWPHPLDRPSAALLSFLRERSFTRVRGRVILRSSHNLLSTSLGE